MPSVGDVLRELAQRFDARVVPSLFAGVTLRTGKVRGWLRSRHRPFVDPESRERVSPAEVDYTADWVIEQGSARAGFFGGIIGVGGVLSVAPEVVGSTVAAIRLGQRLAVVYGFDIDSDRGQMALWRALAAGYEVELPERGPMGMRMSELPDVIRPGFVARSAEGALASAVVKQSARMVGMSLVRLIPVLSTSVAAASARSRSHEIGARMKVVLKGMADAPSLEHAEVTDAVEL